MHMPKMCMCIPVEKQWERMFWSKIKQTWVKELVQRAEVYTLHLGSPKYSYLALHGSLRTMLGVTHPNRQITNIVK